MHWSDVSLNNNAPFCTARNSPRTTKLAATKWSPVCPDNSLCTNWQLENGKICVWVKGGHIINSAFCSACIFGSRACITLQNVRLEFISEILRVFFSILKFQRHQCTSRCLCLLSVTFDVHLRTHHRWLVYSPKM